MLSHYVCVVFLRGVRSEIAEYAYRHFDSWKAEIETLNETYEVTDRSATFYWRYFNLQPCMGEFSGIKPPQMEWNQFDLRTAFKSFKQYCQLIFEGPLSAKIGEEGLKIFRFVRRGKSQI